VGGTLRRTSREIKRDENSIFANIKLILFLLSFAFRSNPSLWGVIWRFRETIIVESITIECHYQLRYSHYVSYVGVEKG
jgi:hypothetical protein